MKKILIVFTSMFGVLQINGQSISMKLEYKSSPDSFYVSMIPTFTQGVFAVGPSQVTIVFSNNYGISAPASASIATSGVNGGAWGAQDFALETAVPNKKYVAFQTTGANIPGGVSINAPVLLFRFRVTGAGGNCIGGTGLLRNYVNGFDLLDPSGLGGDFSTVINEGGVNDYYSTNSSITMQTCAQLILPVHILEFNVRRDNKNGLANWSVTGEEFNADYYELERSTDGILYQPIARIDCRNLPGIQRYEYTDLNITNLNTKTVYYRLKQYDRDARFILTGIRQLRLDISDKGIQMYPNPVKTGFYLNVPFTNPDHTMVSLSLMNGTGQVLQTKEITALQATNYYYDIKGSLLAAGQYYLKIAYEGQVLDIKKFLISKE